MNLQALGLVATSPELIGDIPLSLLYTWTFSALATIAGIILYVTWHKEFEKNVEKLEKGGGSK